MERNETAFLAEESNTSSDIFRCKIGNLPPDTEAVLTFSYVVDLAGSTDSGDNGSVIFTLPSVLNPRYRPAGSPADCAALWDRDRSNRDKTSSKIKFDKFSSNLVYFSTI